MEAIERHKCLLMQEISELPALSRVPGTQQELSTGLLTEWFIQEGSSSFDSTPLIS